MTREPDTHTQRVAIIGLACRFPGARSPEQFWENLRDGRETVADVPEELLLKAGTPRELLGNPRFVKRMGLMEDRDLFDAAFFGYNPREAELTDPQQRVFLELAWEAVERAGYDPRRCPGPVGVYAGVRLSSYLLYNIYLGGASRGLYPESAECVIGNDKDYLTTRVSYKLGFTGPSFDVQSSCSTSLVAVQLACQSLLSLQCDMALAGGVAIFPVGGYLHQEGMILSSDGHCRSFDARADGTVGGSGAGVVVLKRLEDALRDGDRIRAVILGGAMSNDGTRRVGFTAPGVEGQVEAISLAQAMAQVHPDSITYIEAHGTATRLGDPIEVAALKQVFGERTARRHYCAIGSVKSNVGHLDAAAGVAGLIKTVLALEHRQLPASLHFQQPNPELGIEDSPFFVNTELREWQANGTPLRAGVSSFGMGGTNVHLILEEGPPQVSTASRWPWHLLPISAKSRGALEAQSDQLAAFLGRQPDLNLADAAFTLQCGRSHFSHRRLLVCRDAGEAMRLLSNLDPKRTATATAGEQVRPVAFLFSGQGSQYPNMGGELYQVHRVFRRELDRCLELLKPILKRDLLGVLFPAREEQAAAEALQQTELTQPALFAVEYALAQMWMAHGVQPQAMVGHSIGEYVAATIAGVFSLQDALALVAERGRLMQSLPEGSMLAVSLSEEKVRGLLSDGLSVAVVNAPELCVVSGPSQTVKTMSEELSGQGVSCRLLKTSHAFHSSMMDPIVEQFAARVQQVERSRPRLPFLSNVTGDWIEPAEATNPEYWARHLRGTVRFSRNVQTLLAEGELVTLEVGPGDTLCSLVRQHGELLAGRPVFASLRHPNDRQSDAAFFLEALGKMWLAGVPVDFAPLSEGERRLRLELPTYPFQRRRFWIEPAPSRQPVAKRSEISDWFIAPSWRRAPLPPPEASPGAGYPDRPALLFAGDGRAAKLSEALRAGGQRVVEVFPGSGFASLGPDRYAIDPANPSDFEALARALEAEGSQAWSLLYLWTWGDCQPAEAEKLGFFGLIYMARAFGESRAPLELLVVTSGLQAVVGGERLDPWKALLVGPNKVIPEEFPQIRCRLVDLAFDAERPELEETAARQLAAELLSKAPHTAVAYRGGYRWVQWFEPVALPPAVAAPLRQQGVYLVTGGLGGIGLSIAEYLAATLKARLVLVSRSALPPREDWQKATEAGDERSARRIAKVLSLEREGAEVLVLSADVADERQMREVLRQASQRFGALNGIIHAAGVAGGGIIGLKEPDAARKVLSPKVSGASVLERLTRGFPLDFFALCSSMTSILPTSGQVDYTAANAFLDALAQAHSADPHRRFVSINWDTWNEVGMAVDTEVPAQLRQARAESLRLGISPREGVEAFRRALASGLPQLLVCARAYDLRLAIQLSERATAAETEQEAGAAEPQEATSASGRHARPDLSTDYLAPESEVAKRVAEIWGELLGIERVGLQDNFFELGGHSLLGTQVASRTREAFQIDLPLRAIFEHPTVAEFSAAVEEAVQAEVEALSDEEVEAAHADM